MSRIIRNILTRSPRLLAARSKLPTRLTFRSMSEHTGDVSGRKHWISERAVAILLLGSVTTAFVAPCQANDIALGLLMPIHSYWGMQQVLIDYLHPRKFPILGNVAAKSLIAVTVLAALGLLRLNLEGVGITQAIKDFLRA
eukprot:TRINITY_DN5628_c0_g1_i2.p1 TRINITY_DN5628_c0_g1~~TRINITY_DN5628_c0_g1_i2.p1  ORF type:complete len:141 (+),score=57.44 TRINITY_DN5628_c0_g1_i2:45-467(+)